MFPPKKIEGDVGKGIRTSVEAQDSQQLTVGKDEAEGWRVHDCSNSTVNQSEDSEVYEGVQKVFMVDTHVRTAKGNSN